MSGEESDIPQEPLTSWLASCDDALAAGGQPGPGDAHVTPEAQAQRQRGLAFLRLLRRALPPRTDSAAEARADALTLMPKAPAAEEAVPPPEVPGYEVLGELGRGGMGVVYKARHLQLDRLVALKMILAGSHAGADALRRFRTEAEAVARLQHANVVQIYDVGEHQGLPYLALEFCPGGSLAGRLDGTPLPPGPAAALAETLARAVHAAHQAGVVHRDLKPANVLLAADGTPKISDFGLAKKLDDPGGPTRSGAVLGTPSYMAPEQAGATAASDQAVSVSREVGPATDVYALGAMLYELVTGRPPFMGSTPMNTVLQLLTCEPVPPRLLVPKVPRDLETVCLKCLQKDARKRYASAAELAEDLRRFLDDRPIKARPVGWVARLGRWCQRKPAVAGLAAAAAFLLLAGTGASSFFGVQARIGENWAKQQTALAKSETDRANANADAARAAELTVYRRLYVSDLRLAQRAWEDNDMGRLQELLQGQIPERTGGEDLRGFEWHYLGRLSHSGLLLLTFKGQTAPINSVVFSPNGERLGSASEDGLVKVWDADKGEELLTLKGHAGYVCSVVFSPDGQHLASAGGEDRTVKIWDALKGEELLSLRGHTQSVRSVAFSADGHRLASASRDGTVRVWDALKGRELLTLNGHARGIDSVAFSPDGERLASASWDGTVKIWDAVKGEEVLTLQGHADILFSVSFSPDGRRLAAADNNGTVKVWDAAKGEEVLTLKGHTATVWSVVYSPDGERLASASMDGTVKVWDALKGQEVLSLKGKTGQIRSVAFSPNGERLASAGEGGTVKVWNAVKHQESVTLKGPTGFVQRLVFSPDGQRLASSSQDKTVKIWDTVNGQELLTLKEPISWDSVKDLQLLTVLRSLMNGPDPVSGFPSNTALSPDGQRRALGSIDGTVYVEAAKGRTQLTLKGHSGHVFGVAFSPDGERLASASMDGTVKVWDARKGQELLTLKGHTSQVNGVVFSPDGQRLVSGSGDRTIKIWDALKGQELLTLKGHTNIVYRLAFSPDGQRLASASDDGTIKVWYAIPAEESPNPKLATPEK
jgi:WD40 repeat protein